jgi:hypothetical protein
LFWSLLVVLFLFVHSRLNLLNCLIESEHLFASEQQQICKSNNRKHKNTKTNEQQNNQSTIPNITNPHSTTISEHMKYKNWISAVKFFIGIFESRSVQLSIGFGFGSTKWSHARSWAQI